MKRLVRAAQDRIERLEASYDYAERLVPGARAMDWSELRALGHRGRKADRVLARVSKYIVAIEYAETDKELAVALADSVTCAFVPGHWRASLAVARLIDKQVDVPPRPRA